MSFFDSDIVRSEMAEIHELQEDVYENFMKFPYMNTADRAYHIDPVSYTHLTLPTIYSV